MPLSSQCETSHNKRSIFSRLSPVLVFLSLIGSMLLAESSIVLTLTAMPTSIAYASESEVCDPDDAGAPDNDGDESCISKKNLGNRCDSDSNAKSDEGIYCGNPIDMTTGGKYEEEIDYVERFLMLDEL